MSREAKKITPKAGLKELSLKLFPPETGEHFKWKRKVVSFVNNLYIGSSVSAPGMKLFPLLLPPKQKSLTVPLLLIEEALKSRLADVIETGRIGKLAVKNLSWDRILILDGTTFIGGAQNRMAMVPFVVESYEELLFPVVCIEKNRWEEGREGERFTKTGFSFLYLRIKKIHLLLEQLSKRINTFSRGVDEGRIVFGEWEQKKIWETIDDIFINQKMPIETGDFHRVYHEKMPILVRNVHHVKYLSRQAGLAAVIAGNLYLDFFSSFDLMWNFHRDLLLSYALEALRRSKYHFLRGFRPSHRYSETWLKSRFEELEKGDYFVFAMGGLRRLILGIGSKFLLIVLGYDEYIIHGNIFWLPREMEIYI